MAAIQTQGQRHDRLAIDDNDRDEPPAPNYNPPMRAGQPDETSILQKMGSATLGSTLVTLLGQHNVSPL